MKPTLEISGLGTKNPLSAILFQNLKEGGFHAYNESNMIDLEVYDDTQN